MKFNLFLILIVFSLFALSSQGSFAVDTGEINIKSTGEISFQGVINCCPKGLRKSKKRFVYSETSAALFYNDRIYMASDRRIKGLSSVYSFPLTFPLENEKIEYLYSPIISKVAIKIEDFSLSPHKKFAIGATAFDRADGDEHRRDGFNTLFYWKIGSEENLLVANEVCLDGVTSSVTLRPILQNALKSEEFPEGPHYFKIEGIALIPGNKILFGVREMGTHYKEFKYVMKILMGTYTYENEKLTIGNDIKLVLNYKPEANLKLMGDVGISSMEYNSFDKKLYFTTSFEPEDFKKDNGSYIWSLTIKELLNNKPPHLLMDKGNKTPLLMNHKAEGIAIIDEKTLFIAHDEDRHLGQVLLIPSMKKITKEPQMIVYTKVKLD